MYRNPASEVLMEKWYNQFPQFSPPRNTSELQSSLRMNELAAEIKKLRPIERLPSTSFFTKEYILTFEGIGDVIVRDKFYRLNFGCQVYRIFENITSSMPAAVIRGD